MSRSIRWNQSKKRILNMREGDLIVVSMPQGDGVSKNRPAVILREMPPFGDPLVCGLSKQLHQAAKDFDEVVSPSDSDLSRAA
jgi:mRNA interferase MazF